MRRWTIFLIIGLLGLTGFFVWQCQSNKLMSEGRKEDGCFLWMDAYVALPINSEFDIALTYYYFENERNYIHKEDISSITFEGVSNISVKDFSVQNVECENDIYDGYAIHVTIEAMEKGMNYSESVLVQLQDGKQYECPLGTWYFDVDEKDDGKVDAYSSAFMSTDSNKFNYTYMIKEGSNIVELQYWHDKVVKENVKETDSLPIANEAPFNYVKAKGIVEENGEGYRFYGLGNYCGILGAEISDIELSFEHNKMK